MVEAPNTISLYPSTVIATLARYEAVKAVKRHLRSLGVRPRDTTARDIRIAADQYLAQHREELVARASEIVRGSSELLKLYQREQRDRQRWLERKSRHTHSQRGADPQGLSLCKSHDRNGATE
jgi:hypothetical protein